MFRRHSLQFAAALCLLAVGTVAITGVGVTMLGAASGFWDSLGTLPAEAAGTIYVDASAIGVETGVSWNRAYTKLQDALTTAVSGDQIWVAAGVYYPDEGGGMTNDDRTMTFTLVDGVEVYGGFAGGETLLSQRDWETNVTVLRGDIDQNDTTNLDGVVTDVGDIAGSNAYHVVTGGRTSSSAVLDGFTVTAGNADGAGINSRGGGMNNDVSSPTLTNVSFTGNQATLQGGGMYNLSSSATLMNVIFAGNHASDSGGGMYNHLSNLTLGYVTFTGNQADYAGGKYNRDNSLILVSVILWNNQALISDHQISNESSTTLIEQCDIQGSGGSASWDPALGIDSGFNIDTNPLFVMPIDPATAPTTAGDLHLQNGSPAVDTGLTFVCPSTDLDGNTRPIDGDLDGSAECDMGAYEKLIDLFLPLILR